MVKQFNLSLFQTGFAICFFVIGTVTTITLRRNKPTLTRPHKIMIACWIGYLLMLLIASVSSSSRTSLLQWGILFTKFLFFLFLILYINKKFIFTTMRIYANVMAVTVVLALAAVAAIVMGFGPIAVVDLGGRMGDVFFGAFYVTDTPICPPTPIFRIQGLSEEPGTYAFALLPALFWFLIAEEAYAKSAAIVLGLMFSMSLGAGLFLLLVLGLLLLLRAFGRPVGDCKLLVFLSGAICAIGLMYVLANACARHYLENTGNASAAAVVQGCMERTSSDYATCVNRTTYALSTTANGKKLSFNERFEGIRTVISYLEAHPMGTGTALGMKTVQNSIAVGYAVAALESGVAGGIFYLGLFATMGWLALRTVAKVDDKSFDGRVKVVVSLSIGAVLIMGAQRIQPDLSFWHMWLYAIWFHFLQPTIPSADAGSRTL